jgi:ParB family transcriptional regulator, chromosome partitioning protein
METDHCQILKNIQKVSPNAWEIASALKKMMGDLKLTQDQLAQMAGKKRSTVANYLRLFQLPKEIQEHLRSGKLSMGHAKALLSLPKEAQIPFCKEILLRGWPVRKAEIAGKKKWGEEGQVFLKEIKSKLEAHLGTKVAVTGNKIMIDYYSLDDLERVLEVMGYRHDD